MKTSTSEHLLIISSNLFLYASLTFPTYSPVAVVTLTSKYSSSDTISITFESRLPSLEKVTIISNSFSIISLFSKSHNKLRLIMALNF